MFLYQALCQLNLHPRPRLKVFVCVWYVFMCMCIGVCKGQRVIIKCPLLLLSELFSGTRSSPTQLDDPGIVLFLPSSLRVTDVHYHIQLKTCWESQLLPLACTVDA